MNWTPERIEKLRSNWAQGYSAADIGRHMGISKNAVVGKVRRESLPPRASPIKREVNSDLPRAKNYAQQRRRRLSLLPLPSLQSLQAPLPAEPPKPKPIAKPAPPPKPQLLTAKVALFTGAVCKCRFPIGEPRTTGFHFCEVPSVPGASYCMKHCRIAYIAAVTPTINLKGYSA